MKRIALICALLLPMLYAPALADYGCWPFGGVDQLVFPSCTTSGGHRSYDVNVVGAVAPALSNVNVTQFGSNNVVTGTGASGNGIPRVTVANDSNVLATQSGTWAVNSTLQAGTAIVGKFGIDQTTPGTTNGVQVNAPLPAGTNVIGHVIADASAAVIGAVTQSGSWVLSAGSAIIGKVGIDQTTPGTTNGVVVNSGTVTANSNGCNNQGLANTKVAYSNQASEGFFTLIAGVNGQTITICSVSINGYATTTGNIDIVGGTGAACVTTVDTNNTGDVFVGAQANPTFFQVGNGVSSAIKPFLSGDYACGDFVGAGIHGDIVVIYEQH